MGRKGRMWGLFGAFATICAYCVPVTAGEIDFGRQIRRILSDKCFQCHGADEETRGADLRLDHRESAIEDRGGGAAIVPGDIDASLLVERIRSDDPDLQMPPVASKKTLTEDEKQLLEEWIRQGAPYSGHWAFQPVERPPVPPVKNPRNMRNEIDAFVLSRLDAEGLQPSPPADRATLVRRLYQDLLGLAPTPEQADAFILSKDPEAYEKLVESLLGNPHYGERWGRHWLDQARYADSHGFTIDGSRVMWPYRDWVIQAVNDDMPFDQFTIEQLAGDLLESPTKSQLVATAFHRNTLINQEGGVKPDQYRHEAVIDRVNTTGAVWLGLTVGCAQCHTHKFDPIFHDEYYQLYAFFNGCKDANDVGPKIAVHQGEMFGLSKEQQQELVELDSLKERAQKLRHDTRDSLTKRLNENDWQWQQVEVTDYRTDGNAGFERLPDGSLLAQSNGPPNDGYAISFKAPIAEITGLRLRVYPDETLPGGGPGTALNGNLVLSDIELVVDGESVRFKEAWADHEQVGHSAIDAIDGDKQTGWGIDVNAEQKKKFPDLKVVAPHELSLALERPLPLGNSIVTLMMRHDAVENHKVGRFAIDVTQQAPPAVSEQEARPMLEVQSRINELERRIPGKGVPVTQMVMEDQPEPPPTYRLDRGDFLSPDKDQGPLTPGVPQALLNDATNSMEFKNRLDLARWLVHPQNPLTARVTVNRVWMRYFGHGLVDTENDLGSQSAPPTHPELLDWLAAEWMSQGWSMKSLHRLIVNSATYRQSSDFREDLERDPANLLLARQSRFRVEAEIVRDMALSASGVLTSVVGGPSVFPPQPDGVYAFTQTKKQWPESKGPDRYRRTLYTMLYRSAPYPLFSTFDAPDFSTVCTSRPRSDTPLQSLTLANDPMFFEYAQAMTVRAAAESPEATLPERLALMFRYCLTRAPDAEELNVLSRYWKQEQARYAQQTAAAGKVAPAARPQGMSLADAAAWTSVARVLLNTDEFVSRN